MVFATRHPDADETVRNIQAHYDIVIECPSREAAKAFWTDPAFQPLVALRNTGSSMEAMVLDGFVP